MSARASYAPLQTQRFGVHVASSIANAEECSQCPKMMPQPLRFAFSQVSIALSLYRARAGRNRPANTGKRNVPSPLDGVSWPMVETVSNAGGRLMPFHYAPSCSKNNRR